MIVFCCLGDSFIMSMFNSVLVIVKPLNLDI